MTQQALVSFASLSAPLQGISITRTVPERHRHSGRPSQGSPVSRSPSPVRVAAHGFAAPSSPSSRPRGLPRIGQLGPEGPHHSLRLGRPPKGTVRMSAPCPQARDIPSWGFLPLQRSLRRGSAHPGFASPGTFRPRGFSPPRRVSPPLGPWPRGPLPFLGFRSVRSPFTGNQSPTWRHAVQLLGSRSSSSPSSEEQEVKCSVAVGAFWLLPRLTAAEAAVPDGIADLLEFLPARAKPPGPRPRRCAVSRASFRHRPKPPPSGPALDEIRPRTSDLAVPEGPAADFEGLAS
jgi:hypothetical protein